MRIRKINPQQVARANSIMQLVADEKQTPVEMLQSSVSTKPVSYARSLAVYLILTNCKLQWDMVAGMFNYSSVQGSLSYCYHKIRRQASLYEDVKADVINISAKIKQAV